ncbi:PAS domain-containing protein [Notoacmeibacter ruber]|nr:PAS domain-containing protein [Notoacmeibacter ruber]
MHEEDENGGPVSDERVTTAFRPEHDPYDNTIGKDHQSRRVFQALQDDVGANRRIAELGIRSDLFFEQALEQTRMAVCVTDPHQPDNPIVFVNNAFEAMTGYAREDIVGKNCRFLQSPRTDPKMVARLRKAIDAEETCVVEILNRRADGTEFYNSLHVGPIYGQDGRLALFYGSQWDVTDLVEERERTMRLKIIGRELNHRIGNMFAVVGSILRLSRPREGEGKQSFIDAENRIQALSRAHQASINMGDNPGGATETVDLHKLVETILLPYQTEQQRNRVTFGGPEISILAHAVSAVSLTLHELSTNAAKHGGLRDGEGTIRVVWSVDDGLLDLRWMERGAGEAKRNPEHKGTGAKLINTLVQSIDATVEREWGEDGLIVRLKMPPSVMA